MARSRPPKKSGKPVSPTSASSPTREPQAAHLAALRAPLADLLHWLESAAIPHMVIGGVAVSLVSRPRTTLDIDGVLLVDDSSWADLVADAKRHGFSPRERNPVEFIRQARMLLLRHDASGVAVDLSLGALPFEAAAVARHATVHVDDLRIPIPTPEDLIIMKAIAHRPQDMADISAILDEHPGVNLSEIEAVVQQFAEVLEQPELVDDLMKALRPGQRSRPRTGRNTKS